MARIPTIDAGSLREVLVWRSNQLDTPADELGQVAPGFLDRGKIRGRVLPLRGAALIQAAQLKAATWLEVTIRKAVGMKPTDQLLHLGATLTVEAVLPCYDNPMYATVHVTEEPLNPNPAPA